MSAVRAIVQETDILLMPAQQQALEDLRGALPSGDVFVLASASDSGGAAVLREFHAVEGGFLIGIHEFAHSLSGHDPFALEDAFLDMLHRALHTHHLVIVDGLHLVSKLANHWQAERSHLLDAMLTAVMDDAAACRKKLVFGVEGEAPWPVKRRAHMIEIADLAPYPAARAGRRKIYQYAGRPRAKSAIRAKAHRLAPVKAFASQKPHPEQRRG